MITTLYEPFRHWSEGGSVYLLSDLHFNDSDCKLMDPDWVTPEEQLEIINRMVLKNDTFICLGDVGNPKYVPMIKARRKILLLGNHDARGAYKGCFDNTNNKQIDIKIIDDDISEWNEKDQIEIQNKAFIDNGLDKEFGFLPEQGKSFEYCSYEEILKKAQ